MRRPNMDALASATIVLSLVALLLITGESVKLDGRRTRETLATVQTELDAANWLNDRLQKVALCALEGRRPARCLERLREVDETPGPEPGETDPPGVTGPEPSPEPTPPPPDETESPEPTDDPIVDPSDIPPLPTPTIPPVVCELLPILCP